MPTFDQLRISKDHAQPRAMELWWVLQSLKSVTRFMQTGAHPDDETSGMLAALAFRDGLNISYACSTRGEGGQNDIGTETGAELGALRTREMERASDVLGMRLYWHSTDPSDTLNDFGFSKSGEETLARWGAERTMARFVEIIRSERPDILCPTFLDVPGQHGHHRAMTQAAEQVMTAAADPEFPSDLPPWQVKKLYLPAWSGAGQAYDDDLPPPPATLVIHGQDREPLSGWSWDRIGQQSRAFHRTQGMGRWARAGARRDWPLHLKASHGDAPDSALWSGLPYSVADLAEVQGASPISDALRAADAALKRTIAAFPAFPEVTRHAVEALACLTTVQTACPEPLRNDIMHRVSAKIDQLRQVLRLSLGIEARVTTEQVFLPAGSDTALRVELDPGAAENVTIDFALPEGWTITDGTLNIAADALPEDPYRPFYDPRVPPLPQAILRISEPSPAQGVQISVPVPFDVPPVVVPAERVSITPESIVVNRAEAAKPLALTLIEMSCASSKPGLTLPEGWRCERSETGFDLNLPPDAALGTYSVGVTLGAARAARVRRIAHDHVAPTAHSVRAGVQVGVVDVNVPKARVGYIGAGNDRVAVLLQAVGVDVTDLSEADLTVPGLFADFDSIVIGIFAMRFRPGLVESLPALHAWVEAGGTLVTLYHRPWDSWDPDSTPPKRLEIGQPSLRWRVTNEAAHVTHLSDHALLSYPNVIMPEDWQGWVKERGLYFAKSWDPAYSPLLSMADPGEAALTGALLVADIGKGRHVHTSLILHHQMANLVPGAFRLMANLIAPRQ